jgi:hypothetical protein
MAFFAWLPLSGAVPATLTFEEGSWRNESWGFHAIHGHRQTGMVAVAGDGSRLNRLEGSSYRFHFLPDRGGGRIDLLYAASEGAYYTKWFGSDEVQRSECHCTWERLKPDPGADCKVMAQHWLGLEVQRAGTGKVAGQNVVRWRVADQEEIGLAAERGCEVMEKVSTSYGRFGIPAARYRFLVTSYRPGEPDPALFRVPQK